MRKIYKQYKGEYFVYDDTETIDGKYQYNFFCNKSISEMLILPLINSAEKSSVINFAKDSTKGINIIKNQSMLMSLLEAISA